VRHIMIGIPVRERMWALERVVSSVGRMLTNGCIHNVLIPLASVELFFLVQGDYADRVVEMTTFLNALATPIMEEHGIKVTYASMQVDSEIPAGRPWKIEQYEHMVRVRNRLLDEAKSRQADLFSLDSDICVYPDTLIHLLHANRDIVSALVRNHPTADAYNIMWDKFGEDNGYTRDGRATPIDEGVVRVGLTGACYLISYKAIKAGVRYRVHHQGEDAGFCSSARDHGFGVYCDTDHKVLHLYEKGKEPI